jgi:hypothetical protein
MSTCPLPSRSSSVRFSRPVTGDASRATSAPTAGLVPPTRRSEGSPVRKLHRASAGAPAALLLLTTLVLSGCRANAGQHTPPSGVPETAKLITERSGGMGFTAPETGTVYIYDDTSNRVVFRSAVTYRDQLIFYPQKQRVILNGNVVKEDRNLNEEHVHRLYFVKG